MCVPGYTSDASPTAETREGAQVLREVLTMLGMDVDDAHAPRSALQRRASLGTASPSVYSPRTGTTARFPLGAVRSPVSAVRSPGGIGGFVPLTPASALSPGGMGLLSPGARPRSRSVNMVDALQGTTEGDVRRTRCFSPGEDS